MELEIDDRHGPFVKDTYEGLRFIQEKPGLDSKAGYINEAGDVVIPIVYNWAHLTDDNGYRTVIQRFNEGLAPFYKDGKLGFIDKANNTIIDFQYDFGYEFHDGACVVQKDGKYGIINKTNEVLAPFEYDLMDSFSEGMAMARRDGKCGSLNTSGKESVPFIFEYVGMFWAGIAHAKLDGVLGYVNKKGRFFIPEE